MARWARLMQPKLLLGAALLTSGVVLIAWQSHLTFVTDDWDLLIHRRGISPNVFLDPHARHIIIAPTAIYKAIQATIGMESLLPFAVVATGAFLATVVLLFVYLRTRVGEWTALIAVIPILFMGTAYEDLLTPFQIGYFGSMVFGLGALLALQRRDARGDAIACGLLIASLTFSEVAVPFLAGAAVAIALDRGPLSRAYVVAVPALLYAAWYAGWETGPNSATFENVATSPSYILDGNASSLGSLLGFGPALGDFGVSPLGWGRPLLVGLAAVAAIWLHHRGRLSAWLPVTIALAVTFWFLAAANLGLGRAPTASRYQFVGAVFLVMVAAECAAGTRLRWRGLAAVAAIAATATLTNASVLHRSYQLFLGTVPVARGGLTGLEIAAPRVSPGFLLTPENSDAVWFSQVDAAHYLSAVDKFGSPAYPRDELAAAPESARISADKVLTAALGIGLRDVTRPPTPAGPAPRLSAPPGAIAGTHGSCLTLRSPGGQPALVTLPPGGVILRTPARVGAEFKLRRFATSFPVDLGTLRGTGVLGIPQDLSDKAWEIQLSSAGPVTLCGLG
jgi:hypothetical protein